MTMQHDDDKPHIANLNAVNSLVTLRVVPEPAHSSNPSKI